MNAEWSARTATPRPPRSSCCPPTSRTTPTATVSIEPMFQPDASPPLDAHHGPDHGPVPRTPDPVSGEFIRYTVSSDVVLRKDTVKWLAATALERSEARPTATSAARRWSWRSFVLVLHHWDGRTALLFMSQTEVQDEPGDPALRSKAAFYLRRGRCWNTREPTLWHISTVMTIRFRRRACSDRGQVSGHPADDRFRPGRCQALRARQ